MRMRSNHPSRILRRGMVVLALLLAVGLPAVAQTPPEDRDLALLGAPAGEPLAGIELDMATESVSALMRCPVCQGLSVADSHTESALAMRSKAESLLAEGYSADQVLTYFESSYGEFIRLSPRPEGFNLLVWALPAAGLLLGLALVWARLRRRGAVRAEAIPEAGNGNGIDPGAEDDELTAYRERVRREVGG